MTTEKLRAFIAVHLPEEVRTALEHVNEALAQQVPRKSVRWVTPERMHLTMRFLGDTAVSNLPTITAALDQATQGQSAFTLTLGQLGCFPNRRRPRVIWVGLDGNLAPLWELKRQVDAALQPLGWEPETRPFRAHLTLGRVKDSRLLADLDWGAAVEELPVPVTAVHLVQSELRSSGPIYTVLHSSQLS